MEADLLTHAEMRRLRPSVTAKTQFVLMQGRIWEKEGGSWHRLSDSPGLEAQIEGLIRDNPPTTSGALLPGPEDIDEGVTK